VARERMWAGENVLQIKGGFRKEMKLGRRCVFGYIGY
jgi:hypothetical protein